jgi:hypothetical protein
MEKLKIVMKAIIGVCVVYILFSSMRTCGANYTIDRREYKVLDKSIRIK